VTTSGDGRRVRVVGFEPTDDFRSQSFHDDTVSAQPARLELAPVERSGMGGLDERTGEVEAALVGHWSHLGRWTSGRLVDEGGVLRYETPIQFVEILDAEGMDAYGI
jgi:hypothetical protein